MELDILESVLVDKIKAMPERKLLLKAENALYENEITMQKIALFQSAQEEYNFMLKIYGENHELTKQKQKELYQAKLEMDNDELIKTYQNLLNKCKEPLLYLEFNLLSLFKRRLHSCSE